MNLKTVHIFSDGACRGNPGPGGWGVLLRYNGTEKSLHGSERHTTNNRMELSAAIAGLEALSESCHVHLTTDSRYVKDGIESWLAGWKKKGWKTAARKPVKNDDLWKKLDSLVQQHQVDWHWVRGHSGHEENERVDQLANQAIDEMLAKEDA